MSPTMPPFLHRIRSTLLCLAVLLGACAPAWSAPPLTVFAAASLKESLDQVGAAYRKHSGTDVRIAYAASSALARQIEQGAPAQVFVSADLEWMDYLQARGRIVPSSRHNLLGNRLVLIAPATSTVRVDLKHAGALAQALGTGRLATGQTATVPAGKYARAALESLGHWKDVQPRLAESENVRTALMLVARGEAPLGVVYASDAKAEPRVRVVAAFPDDSHPPIVYPLAAVAPASPAALAFARWLEGPEARAIFQQHGFRVLD